MLNKGRESDMANLERIIAERACERLIVEYCECVDTRNFEKLVSLFSIGGVLKRPDGEWKGRGEIRAFFDKLTLDPLIHASSNILVVIDGLQSGKATSYVTVSRSYSKNAD